MSDGKRYAPFTLGVYLHEYKDYLVTKRFDAMLPSSNSETFYDALNRFDRDTALGAWVHRLTHCGGCSKVVRSDDVLYVYMRFVSREDEHGYAAQLTA